MLSSQYLESHCKDGWWPYFPDRGESLEATAWCAIACRKNPKIAATALDYLIKTQNQDGGWSTAPKIGDSDWSTSLALIAINVLSAELSAKAKTESAVTNGLKFLSSHRTDMLNDLGSLAMLLLQGPEFDYVRGWPWTTNTYNWVEPTAYAILAIRTSSKAQDQHYKKVIKKAHEYLLEKCCTLGGWNFGQTQVLGEDWPPTPGPTSLTLISMQGSNHEQVKKALSYLQSLPKDKSTTKLALALSILAANTHGEDTAAHTTLLKAKFADNSNRTDNLCTTAIASIALNLAKDGNPLALSASTQAKS